MSVNPAGEVGFRVERDYFHWYFLFSLKERYFHWYWYDEVDEGLKKMSAFTNAFFGRILCLTTTYFASPFINSTMKKYYVVRAYAYIWS